MAQQQQQLPDLAALVTELTNQNQRQLEQFERHHQNKRKFHVFSGKQAPTFDATAVGRFILQMDHLKPPTPSDGYELLLAAAPQPMQQKVMRAVDLMKVIKRAAHDDSTWNEDALNEVIFSLQSNTIERQVDELKREIGKKKRTLGSGKTPVRLWLDELRVDYQLLEYLKRIETWKRTAPVPTADASTFPKVTSDKSQEDQNNEFLIHVTRECLDTDLSLKVEAALKAQGAPRATSIEQLEGIISMVEDTHNAGKAANSNLTDLTKTFSVFLDAQTGPK